MSAEYSARNKSYANRFAYCLIPYVNDSGDADVVWNSRDGGIASALRGTSGRVVYPMLAATIVQARYYVPPIGSVILVDPDFDQIVLRMRELIDASWEDRVNPGMRHHLFSRLGREGSARFMAQARVENEQGHPIVVDEKTHEHFRQRAASRVMGRANLPSEVLADSCPPEVSREPREITLNWWRMGKLRSRRVPLIGPWAAAVGPVAAWLSAAGNSLAGSPLLSSIG